jgi:hypothetical protein
MSQGLMTLIGGVLIFLATIIPVITSILRWVMQKGVPALALMAVCFALVALAFYATAVIGVFRKWNIHLIFSLLSVYAIFYTATFLVPIGVPTRLEDP